MADFPSGDVPRGAGSMAARLMQMALVRLDEDGEALAAVRQQHAIDTLERRSTAAMRRTQGFPDSDPRAGR